LGADDVVKLVSYSGLHIEGTGFTSWNNSHSGMIISSRGLGWQTDIVVARLLVNGEFSRHAHGYGGTEYLFDSSARVGPSLVAVYGPTLPAGVLTSQGLV